MRQRHEIHDFTVLPIVFFEAEPAPASHACCQGRDDGGVVERVAVWICPAWWVECQSNADAGEGIGEVCEFFGSAAQGC